MLQRDSSGEGWCTSNEQQNALESVKPLLSLLPPTILPPSEKKSISFPPPRITRDASDTFSIVAEFIAVHQAYQNRRLAVILIDWLFRRCDATQLNMYSNASIKGYAV